MLIARNVLKKISNGKYSKLEFIGGDYGNKD